MGQRVYVGLLGFYFFIYSLAHFPSIETWSGFYGMTFGLLHPGSFPGDLSGNYHPIMVSLQALLVKTVGGDLWLDERFQLLWWMGIIAASVIGVHYIMRLMGVTSYWAKLVIWAVIMGHHLFVANIPRVIDLVCFRPTTYTGPFIIWLSYFLLKGNSFWPIMLLMVIGIAVSVKTMWLWAVVAIIFLFKEYGRFSFRKIVALVGGGLTIVFVGNYYWQYFHGSLQTNTLLFDSAKEFENSEANPMVNGLGPYILMIFVGLGCWFRWPEKILTMRWRWIMGVFLVMYVMGTIYYSFSPDFLKIPFFVALSLNRSSWWFQVLLFMFLTVRLLNAIEQTSSRQRWFPILGLVVLFFFPFVEYEFLNNFPHMPFQFDKHILFKAPVFLGLWLGGWIVYQISKVLENKVTAYVKIFQPRHILYAAMIGTMICSVLFKLYENKEYLRFLFRYGIMGCSPSAKWIGVNEFFRNETNPNSTILAMAGRPLELDSALKIRTGRTMPYGHHRGFFYFDLNKQRINQQINDTIAPLPRYWQSCDIENIQRILGFLHDPDYIVVPDEQLCSPEKIGYGYIKTINHFSIWKKYLNTTQLKHNP